MLSLCHVVRAPAVDYQSVDSQRADQASSTNMRQCPNRWLLGSRLRKQATISDWARLSPWTILASDTIHCCASVCLLQLVFSVLQSKMEQIARSYYCLFNMWVWRGVSLVKTVLCNVNKLKTLKVLREQIRTNVTEQFQVAATMNDSSRISEKQVRLLAYLS